MRAFTNFQEKAISYVTDMNDGYCERVKLITKFWGIHIYFQLIPLTVPVNR
jgi:hypothetical protein